MIYINGYWNRITGFLGLSPSTPAESYWNYFSPLFISSSRLFMGAEDEESNQFIDGSSLFGIDQSADDRYMYGYKYAQNHYDELIRELKLSKSFKFISHSEGGAFATGMADYLISQGLFVERVLYLSPREADAITSPGGVFTIQVHFMNDPVCIAKRINEVGVYLNLSKLDGKKVSLRYAHGGTVKASTIRKVQWLLNKLPQNSNKNPIVGQWTITETNDGIDYKRVEKLSSENG